ncbi:cytochrome-c peroxidase [Hymenobacter sp. 15J16-1T3B]|uniref:cytochrome-c peroxidase n=1 Tax=Hymenobacter sp. 15J16-1T3B TaxID=2886941 RepID=UPI001D12311B|nr:cytochrome c peroxidase [Hymenobacter sp. 15J16-1T3B]MCC3158168.1 cytochrome-c peroxidase [Hymenobacter sp. 15J16-1T3B]
MRRAWTVPLAAVLAGLLMAGCHPDADVLSSAEPVPGSVVPANFPPPAYGPELNAPDRATFELGRSLFYDPLLSRDSTVSCGTCHRQTDAFADAGQRLSAGVLGHRGLRNAPPLQNLRWRRTLMWDGAVAHIENLPLAPLTNAQEMDETLPRVLAKLNRHPAYPARFASIYGPGPITSYQFLRALAQFTAALTSANSRYDQYVRHEPGGTLSVQELRGLTVFRANCASCHATDLFTDETYRNNGLDRSFAQDSGRARITGRPDERGLFKVPSLRNVARTAPYMHDGRFQTLDQVLDHYDHGVVPSGTLDPLLRRPDGSLGIRLDAEQRADLRAFLLTLTDDAFLHNPQLAPPR